MNDDRQIPSIPSLSASAPVVGQSVLAELEQAWWAVVEADSVPRRSAISAMTLGNALPHGFILERVAPGHARLRVAGRNISAMIGTEARGMPMSCLLSAASRRVFSERLERVFADPAIIDMPIVAPRGIGRPRVTGRLLILPLCDESGEVNRAMGALILDGPVGSKPRRCDIMADDPWRCDTVRPLRSQLRAISGDRVLARPAHKRDGGALRLVVDNA